MSRRRVSDGWTMRELLPGGVATAEASEPVGEQTLLPAELALIDRAHPKRRVEFATARHCARCALAELEIASPAPILRGASREPLWPKGVVGSITHCGDYHAAAVGRTSRFLSIGIDAEADQPLPEGVLEEVSLPAERAQLSGDHRSHFDRLLFSAKESIYKAWFPLAGRWLGFADALITLHPEGTFDVEVIVSGPIETAQGRWRARDGYILTAIALPATQVA